MHVLKYTTNAFGANLPVCQIIISLSSPPEAKNVPLHDHLTLFTHATNYYYDHYYIIVILKPSVITGDHSPPQWLSILKASTFSLVIHDVSTDIGFHGRLLEGEI